jgi:hypothetical protein
MPTSAIATPDVAFLDPGWCSEDGLAKAISVSSTDINGFGSSQPLRTLKTQQKTTFDLAFLESNPIVLAVYNELALDALVPDVDGAFDFTEGPIRNQRYATLFDIVDGDNLIRAVCPNVQVTDKQSLAFKNSASIAYGVTMTAYPGSDGTAIHWYYQLGALAA